MVPGSTLTSAAETFEKYANRWMKTRTDLAPTTTGGKYDGLVRLHILPRLDRLELGHLSAAAVRARCR